MELTDGMSRISIHSVHALELFFAPPANWTAEPQIHNNHHYLENDMVCRSCSRRPSFPLPLTLSQHYWPPLVHSADWSTLSLPLYLFVWIYVRTCHRNWNSLWPVEAATNMRSRMCFLISTPLWIIHCHLVNVNLLRMHVIITIIEIATSSCIICLVCWATLDVNWSWDTQKFEPTICHHKLTSSALFIEWKFINFLISG